MASNFAPQIQTYHGDRVRYFPVTAAQTFIAGALVFLTSGAVSECGADPTSILGIACAPASVGLDAKGSFFGDLRGTTMIPVYVLNPVDVVFMASGTTPVYATHVGQAYGIEKTTNWRVDPTDAVNTRVTVIDVSLSPVQEGWFVRFLAANLQFDSIAS